MIVSATLMATSPRDAIGTPNWAGSFVTSMRERASELGITAFLPKPTDFDALTALIDRQCAGCTGAATSNHNAGG